MGFAANSAPGQDVITLIQSRSSSIPGPGDNPRIGVMYLALFVDFVWLAARMYAIFQQKDIDIGCDFLFTMFWYPLTLYVLGGVFPGTDLWQGVDMVTQQLTSIGYGGASVRGNDQKLFHAVNGLASQMGPNNIPGYLVDFLSDLLIAAFKPILDDIDSQKTSSKVITEEKKLTKEAKEIIERYGEMYSNTP